MAEMPDEDRKYDPPQERAGDKLHMIARAAISSVPVIGSVANEFFQAIIAPPLRKRQSEWMDDIAAAVRRLEEQPAFSVEALTENEAFIDTVLHASQVAVRTTNEEKRKALQNAVLNSALPNPPDESKRQLFLQFVDTLTVWHLRLLDLLVDPLPWFQRHNKQPVQFHLVGHIQRMILGAFPDLQRQDDFIEQCVSDLQARGLLSRFNFHVNMSGQGVYEPRGSQLGKEFIAFLNSPALPE